MKRLFPKNLNLTGRILRLLIGVALLVYAYLESSWIAFAFALFTFFEALRGWCIIYQLFGWNSCPVSKDKPRK